MTQRLRGIVFAGPAASSDGRYHTNHSSNPDHASQTFEITFYVFMCFVVASILWLLVCYFLYRLVRGCTINSDPKLIDNYDALESDYSDCDEEPERRTHWKKLLGFTKQKVGEPTSTHSLQLVHVGPAPRTQSMPVLVNLDGKSLFLQHKPLNQS